MTAHALRAALHAAAPLGAAWLLHRRRLYRRIGVRLTTAEHARLDPWCDPTLLGPVRVARVPYIRHPVPPRLAPRGMLDLSSVRAMAFIDTVVIADANQHPGDDPISLLFHELVHVAQFHLLGVHAFVRTYLRGWLDSGRSYLDNPLEASAFELQRRFDAGDRFDILQEAARSLGVRSPGVRSL